MEFDFDDCYWHDSILESIFIDRSDPGNNDIIEMVVDWYDEPKSKIVFDGVCLFKSTMNFGIIAKEAIDMACIAPADDPDLVSFYEKWKGAFNSVKLNCYIIKTSATGGEIKILAESVGKVPI